MPHGPNLNLIHEHFLNTQKSTCSINSTIGIHIPVPVFGWRNLYGAFAREEIRWYSIKSGLFMGAEFSGGYQTFDRNDSIECAGCTSIAYNSKRAWLELNLNLGSSNPLNNGLFFEFYISIGSRFYDNNVSISNDQADLRYWGDWTNPRYYREARGKNLAPKITMNCKMSLWKFRTNRRNKKRHTTQ